jgi:hypothetical protein
MELAVAPPPRMAAGVKLATPLVVTFSGSSGRREGSRGKDSIFALPDLSGIWVFLSLTTADMTQSLAPPREDLFCGNKADSIHQVTRPQGGNTPTVAYAMFQDLKIMHPGRYRIKVNLLDMDSYAFKKTSRKVHPLTCTRAYTGLAARVLPPVHSPIFEVVRAETVSRLRSIGVDV